MRSRLTALMLCLLSVSAHAQYPQRHIDYMVQQCIGGFLATCDAVLKTDQLTPDERARVIKAKEYNETMRTFNFTLVFGLFAAALYGIYYWLFGADKTRRKRQLAASPDSGPMRIDLRSEPVPAKNAKYRLHGGDHWHRLHINVVMSKKDRLAYERTGLIENELFRHPNPEFPDMQVSYLGHHLFNTPYVDFPNIQELDGAKASLIDGLYAVRSRLEAHRDEPKRETHEI